MVPLPEKQIINPCMAHRGWSSKAPENTLTAIQLAVENESISYLELDVQLTKDGIPVLMHDFTLERTTNGQGLVKDRRYEELSILDAGSWFGEAFVGEKIPTLEEVFQLVQGKKILNLELKKTPSIYHGLEEKVLALIKQYNLYNSVYLTSFDHECIKRIRELDDQIETGLIILGSPTLLEEQLRETGASALSIAYPYLTKELVTAMMAQGVRMTAWTVNDREHITWLQGMHEELIICTDKPELMI